MAILSFATHLTTQVEVAQQNGALDGRNDEDDENNHQEAKDVVHFVAPTRRKKRVMRER